jgi:hypothetical protein
MRERLSPFLGPLTCVTPFLKAPSFGVVDPEGEANSPLTKLLLFIRFASLCHLLFEDAGQ